MCVRVRILQLIQVILEATWLERIYIAIHKLRLLNSVQCKNLSLYSLNLINFPVAFEVDSSAAYLIWVCESGFFKLTTLWDIITFARHEIFKEGGGGDRLEVIKHQFFLRVSDP